MQFQFYGRKNITDASASEKNPERVRISNNVFVTVCYCIAAIANVFVDKTTTEIRHSLQQLTVCMVYAVAASCLKTKYRYLNTQNDAYCSSVHFNMSLIHSPLRSDHA